MTEAELSMLLNRVEAMAREVQGLRELIWALKWADGRHADAPEKPKRDYEQAKQGES